MMAWLPVHEAEWSPTAVQITVTPLDARYNAFLQELTQTRDPVLLAYGQQATVAHTEEHDVNSTSTDDRWTLVLRPTDWETRGALEMNYQECTADQIAQQRTERLLLNRHLPTKTKDFGMRMIAGAISGDRDMPLRVERSPLPALYSQFGDRPELFLQVAWITVAGILRLAGTVATITSLELSLEGAVLTVEFSGRRTKQYVNAAATTIAVAGSIQLD